MPKIVIHAKFFTYDVFLRLKFFAQVQLSWYNIETFNIVNDFIDLS
jgi:hypothetical protein